jgi:hypothetical protein
MAKRPTPRAQADDMGAAPADPKPRRSRASQTNSPTPPGAPLPPDPPATRAAASDERATDPGPRPEALDAPGFGSSESLESRSMASEPSEQDIRMRAYHRYLERGGTEGGEFNDWVEAERELKTRR